MSVIVDNIELDTTNFEFNYAADLVKNTDKLIYLTGKAGSGKTTFLKFIKQTTTKKTVILAPTGVAALNAGGQTIHSFFKIPPSIYLPNDFRLRTKAEPDDEDKRTIFDNFKYRKGHKNLILGVELLIIDEISMVRCDLLDVVDRLLRVFRERESEPFGGVQVVLIGDAFQLPPIAQNEQWELLKEYYETPFFFSSLVLKENKPQYIELKKIYRQHDREFINLLNNIRINQVSKSDLDLLNSRFIPTIFKNENLNYVTIATHNRIVDETNKRKLDELSSELKVYEAEITGDFPESMMPTEQVLNLKEGSQIMFIKNDAEKKYFNGKIATIKKLENTKIVVELPEGKEIDVKKYTWTNIKYTWNKKAKKIDEEIIGEFTQFPIKLAWSITVHKCQGLTFENVIADLSDSFSPGQVYVALSRCTSIDGLILKSRISRQVIKTDPHVIKFAENETHFE
ncbi:MAG: AAA family ATPase [FCB group bacterium]|jgi:ATP-dependent exoDNAse (exonuclease V) alpha subunit